MKTKILLFGASGFIGKNLMAALANTPETKLVALSRNWDKYPAVQQHHTDFLHADLENSSSYAHLLDEKTIVIDLAFDGIPSQPEAVLNQELSKNLYPHLELLSHCVEAKVRCFVFGTSGGTVYGNLSEKKKIQETQPCNPHNIYGLNKVTIENFIRSQDQKLNHLILRFANPYGPCQDIRKGVGFIAKALDCIKHSEEMTLYGSGNKVRDFIYIEDLCRAIAGLLFRRDLYNETFNIGQSIGYSLNQIITIIEDVTGEKIRIKRDDHRMFDAYYNILNHSKIQASTGWQPKEDIYSGIRKHWEFVSQSKTIVP